GLQPARFGSLDREWARKSRRKTVASRQIRRKEVTQRMQYGRRADASGPGAEPAEDQRREKHGQAVRVHFGEHVPEREQRTRNEEAGANLRPQHLACRRKLLVESRQQVAAIESLFWQCD